MIVAYLVFFAKNTCVDWLDFLHYSNTNFENTNLVIDHSLIGKQLGEVRETAPTKINKLTFHIKEYQAGFLTVGTKFFEIIGYESKGYLGVLIDDIYYLYKASNYELPSTLLGEQGQKVVN